MNIIHFKSLCFLVAALSVFGCRSIRPQRTMPEPIQIRELIDGWFIAWNKAAESYSMAPLISFYGQDETELIVFDSQSPLSTRITGWKAYRSYYEPTLNRFESWYMQPFDEIDVLVNDNIAVAIFTFQGIGILKSGKKIISRQDVTHIWSRKPDGSWVIVHEHFSPAK